MLVSFLGAALLFSCVFTSSCAPVQGECADAHSSSMQLLSIVKNISTQNASKDQVEPVSPIHWMEAKDKCDPSSLREKSVQCLEKMYHVLGSYRTELGGLKSCPEFTSKLIPAMKKLQEDMSMCLWTRGRTQPTDGPRGTGTIKNWEDEVLCHYTVNRLFSFSILAARVFAVGDPANHDPTQSTASCPIVA